MMKIGDRVELKFTGEQGKLESFDYHLAAPICTVILDDGREVKANVMEIRKVVDKAAKQKELMKMVKKGGDAG